MDDYNTATLPHEKYYDLNAWHYKCSANAESGNTEEKTTFDDEAERKRELASQRDALRDEKVAAARRDLLASGKVSMMREQERLRAEQQLAFRTGDLKTARDIADILRPTDDDQVEWDVKTGQYRKVSKLNV
mmetsp:Transcript_6549/g.16671  ORF Transcript_6549/g.16671 Transcript_6549/m.16671 type:complete len:132 (-) Transcript_6549:240-635(-)